MYFTVKYRPRKSWKRFQSRRCGVLFWQTAEARVALWRASLWSRDRGDDVTTASVVCLVGPLLAPLVCLCPSCLFTVDMELGGN